MGIINGTGGFDFGFSRNARAPSNRNDSLTEQVFEIGQIKNYTDFAAGLVPAEKNAQEREKSAKSGPEGATVGSVILRQSLLISRDILEAAYAGRISIWG